MRSYLISVITILLLVAVSFSAACAVMTTDDPDVDFSDNLFRRMLKRRRRQNPQDGGFLVKSSKGSKGMKKKQKSFKLANGREEVIDPNDTGLRYQKFEMYENKEKPVATYPMSQELSTLLRTYSNAFSVVTREDYEMRGHDVTKYIEKVGGFPPRPTRDPNGEYWKQFQFVCDVQMLRLEGKFPQDRKIWTPPDLWENDTFSEVVEKVHDEYPGGNQAALLFSWFANRKDIQLDYDILPFRCIDDFIGTEVRLAAILSWSIQTVAPINFCAKWHVGQLRPEEMAWKITNGTIAKDDVPNDIYEMVMNMNLTKATNFTQYPEGSPNHPSWPAMHSAASSMSLWLAVVANLTKEQYCQVLRTDWAVSIARTLAGVHYVSDNIDGLNMGQEVVAEELAKYLVGVYGANGNNVREKIQKFRFDWNNFDPQECTTT